VKKILGDQRPLLCRLGVEDLLPGGLSLADGLFTAAMIAEAGVDVIDVSGGLCGHLHPFVAGPGFFAPQAEAVKRAVHVPVIAVGGVKTPQHAEEIVHSGRADLVAVGRAILSDPDWAARAGHRSSGDSGRSAGGC
jgi:2,4-dienoyl-CoA reductase-like NADH-dependent reductase (Old Yellow Enzyme family)